MHQILNLPNQLKNCNLSKTTDESRRMPPEKTLYDEMDSIGRGAYGIVYKGKHKTTGKIVALKKISVPLNDDGVPMNTLREIGVLKQLNSHEHPNIVQLLDVCHGIQTERELLMYLVFEHVDQDLALYMEKYAKRGGFSSVQIRNMSQEILRGVDFLHSNRIVHRDLKPQNLLVTNEGHIKIADFGLAKTYDFEMRLTSVVVTLWYRAPEVLLGVPYATPVDVWSIGCIIAELFSLKPLFYGSSESDQLSKILRILGKPPQHEWPDNSLSINWDSFDNTERIDFKEIIQNLGDSAHDLLTKMLTFDPKKRMSTLDALNHVYFTEEPI
ncbi:cyclin-dependent kinase 4 isoform X2 [Tribolium castaneum]|uniref:cyclin-dependent kinase 4 isoform X2 n=1 Tax=Tribolium castaneum TaxID=7070 RepID=UPI00046C391D|nr:PREDICTED: cyclin-dependent kinase 4 isoform X2 [Tribolium castaneum]|eukprot:XP_008196448.1 PREDICTED: cyclin-dependent kinase 4 isoform X2 [Tribolium castaneum]